MCVHTWDRHGLDNLDNNLPSRDAVQDLYGTHPTQEACPRSYRLYSSHLAAAWARSHTVLRNISGLPGWCGSWAVLLLSESVFCRNCQVLLFTLQHIPVYDTPNKCTYRRFVCFFVSFVFSLRQLVCIASICNIYIVPVVSSTMAVHCIVDPAYCITMQYLCVVVLWP